MKIKINFYVFIIAYITILSSCNLKEEPNDLQNTTENVPETNKKDYSENKTKPIEYVASEYTVPSAVSYINKTDRILIDVFRPIGWSADGKFAYFTEYADEATGGYSVNLTIQDLRTNKKIWEWDFFDEGAGENIDSVWEHEYDNFKTKLNEYKITQTSKFELLKNNIIFENKIYQAKIKTTDKTDPDFGFNVISKGEIFIEKNNEKSLIYKFTEDSPSMILGTIITGYIQSPQKDLIAILYQKERRGYEGPPNVVLFEIVGCNLSKY